MAKHTQEEVVISVISFKGGDSTQLCEKLATKVGFNAREKYRAGL
jgi:hypothetical protein